MRSRTASAGLTLKLVWRLGWCLGVTLLFARAGVSAPPEVAAAPETPQAVTRAIEAEFLTPEERRELRLKHGLWEAEDLEDVTARARAALMRGKPHDDSLNDEKVPRLLRAEAKLALGKLHEALALLEGETSARGLRLRGETLHALGRNPEALVVLDELSGRLVGGPSRDAGEVVDGVLGLMLKAVLREPGDADRAGADFKGMMSMLSTARERLDKLSPDVPLAEAELLYSKDNYTEALGALDETLAFNPSHASAWALLGRVMVDGFDFERAEAIAARLNYLAADPGDSEEAIASASIDAAMILARARLRQSDPADAQKLLDAQLARHPEHLGLLALRAAAAAAAYEFDDCDARLRAFDALSPASPEAYHEVGRTLSAARQYAPAARYLNEAVRRAPFHPEPVIDLGLLEMQSGRNGEAMKALESAAKLDRFNVRAANSLTLLRDLAGFARIESEHFVIRYKPGEDEVLAREMPAVLERIHARVCGRGPGGIDHVPAAKTVVELMPDHRFFSVRITGMPKLHTIAAATGPVIAMEAPREGAYHKVGAYDWPRVVQHEFTHTVTLSRTDNRLPHWFTEAGAVYLEDRPRDFRTVQLLSDAFENDALFGFDEINLAFVRPKRPADRPLAYAQGHWMYEYMIERFGPRAPLELMDLYAKGVKEPRAFEEVLKVSREAFLAEFKAWAGERLIAWGVRLPEGTPSVEELATREGAGGEEATEKKEPTPEMIEAWVHKYPEHPDVLLLAIRASLAQSGGKPTQELVPRLELYATRRPVDPLPHQLLARYYLDTPGEDAGRAIPHLAWLDEREQSSTSFTKELARLHAERQEWDAAMRCAERAVGIAPYDAPTREFAATIALRAGALADAERHIWALTVLEPTREVHAQRLEAVRRKRAEK